MQIIPAGSTGKGEVAGVAINKSNRGSEALQPGSKTGDSVGRQSQVQANEEKGVIDEAEVIRAIEHANKSLEGVYTQFEFSIHEKTREIMVKVIDRETGDVIREIPPEKILDIVAKMWELAGILIDERV